MEDTYTNVLPKSKLGVAIAYTYSLLPRLSRYVNDGRVNIDNNLIENAIRPLALGRLCCTAHNLPYVGNTIMLALKDNLFVFKRIDTTMPTYLVAV